jgi:SAM-dependent methyltransferase
MQVLESIENFYSSEKIVKFYTETSLFPIEEIVFKKYLDRKGTILDLCCGAGRASFPLSKRGFEVIGVDINEKLINVAREKGKNCPNVHFILSDVEKAELPENYFDYVLILHNSLEFIPTKKKRNNILRKLYQCLKKDGLLITTFHSAYFPFHVVGKLIMNNIRNIHEPEMEYNDFFYKKDGLFYHVFTPREIYRAFSGTGFKLYAVHGSRELLAGENPVKKLLGKLLIPFDYTFWVFNKK